MDEFKSLKDHVYTYIKEQIENGSLNAGDRIPEQAICDELHVSRTPVREALIRLVGDGYLDNEPRKGFRVHGFSHEDALQVFQIIGPLDGESAFLAADTISEETLLQMEFLLGAMDLAIDSGLYDRYDDLQKEFHGLYQDACGNKRLVDIIDIQSLHFIKRSYNQLDQDQVKELLKKANQEHREIYRLFKERKKFDLRNYIADVHWDIDNAFFATWE